MLRPQSTTLGYRLRSVAGRYRTDHPANEASTKNRPGLLACGVRGNLKKTAFDPSGPAARAVRMARLEAVLLIAREPLPTRRLAQLASLADGTEARTLVRQLGKLYDQQGTAFCVEEMAGGFQLMTRPQFAGWLRRLFEQPDVARLSTPAMETLSVVAYRQPVMRADIEAIRGVGCGEILRQLMERDLVKISGRSEELGRPFLYGTSRQFLLAFGLRHLDELPRAEQLRGVGIELSTDADQDPHQAEESEVSAKETEQRPTDRSVRQDYPIEEDRQESLYDETELDDDELDDGELDDDELDDGDRLEDDEIDDDELDDDLGDEDYDDDDGIEESDWEEVSDDDPMEEEDDDGDEDDYADDEESTD